MVVGMRQAILGKQYQVQRPKGKGERGENGKEKEVVGRMKRERNSPSVQISPAQTA
jgi:hypothetical protein